MLNTIGILEKDVQAFLDTTGISEGVNAGAFERALLESLVQLEPLACCEEKEEDTVE